MLLNSITLKNIRSYKTETIDFPRGITLFEGDIGSGKSTVLMGVEFALFGLGSKNGNLLLNTKAKEGSVKLHFEVDGVSYEIVREIWKKNKSVLQNSKNCYLVEDGVREPLAATELKQRILQILKFNESSDPRSESRIFRYAIFTPQEEMKNILLNATNRLETIRKAFNLETYQTAIENASDLIRNLDNTLTQFVIKSEDLDELIERKKKVTLEIKKMGKKILDLSEQKSKLIKQQILYKKRYSNLQKKKSSKDKLLTNIDAIQSEIIKDNKRLESINYDIDEYDEELKKISANSLQLKQVKKPTNKSLDQIKIEINKYRKLEKKINGIDSKYTSELEQVKELSIELNGDLKLSIKSLEKELSILKKSISEYNKIIEKNKQEKYKQEKNEIHIKEKINIVNKKILNLKSIDTKCPICETKLSLEHITKLKHEHKKKLKEFNDNLKIITDRINKLSLLIKNITSNKNNDQNRYDKIEITLPKLEKLSIKNLQLNKTKKELQKLRIKNRVIEEKNFPNKNKLDPVSYLNDLKEASINFFNISKQIKDLKKQINKSVEEKKNISSNLNDLRKNEKQIQLQIDESSTLDQELSDTELKKNNLNDQMITIEKSLSEENTNRKNSEQDIEDTHQKFLKSNQAKKDHDKYFQYKEWIQNFFVPAIRQIETQVMRDIQYRFNETYQNWYSMLIEDPSKESRIDEDFTPILFQDGYYQDLKYLSGGEKTSIALAYRLTLNSMMRQETDSLKSNLLILDEPTDGFSPSQLSKIRNILQELHSQQIILVSHEKELENYVDNIFHITKDQGTSKVTKIN